jgi:hypothetical protein
MATPLSVSNLVDQGGDVLLVKYVRTGYNNPGFSTSTATTVLGGANIQAVNAGSTLTMTADSHLGVLVQLNVATGSTVTLPAATGTGNTYELYVSTTVTSNNHIVQAAGSDKIDGVVVVASAGTSGTFSAVTNTTFTMNGTTTGGVKGTSFFFTDVASARWLVEANVVGTGVAATPISA